MEQKDGEGLLIGGLSLAVIGLIVFMMWWNATNREARLREVVYAEQTVCKNHFDKMWKILQEQADVASEYKDAFIEAFPKIMEERYGNKESGALLNFVKESNPNFDVSLYSTLQKSIASERTEFAMHQDKLIDKNREHRTLLRTKPTSFFFSDADTIHITIVTSARTNAAFTTGEDNDVDLFDRRGQ